MIKVMVMLLCEPIAHVITAERLCHNPVLLSRDIKGDACLYQGGAGIQVSFENGFSITTSGMTTAVSSMIEANFEMYS